LKKKLVGDPTVTLKLKKLNKIQKAISFVLVILMMESLDLGILVGLLELLKK